MLAVDEIQKIPGRTREMPTGMAAFADAFRPKRMLLVGGDGIATEEFLAWPATDWLAS